MRLPRRIQQFRRGPRSMTVCIAAIYTVKGREEWGIWAVSDRRLTEGGTGVVTEPELTKMFRLGDHALVLSAGSSTDDRALWEHAEHRRLNEGLVSVEELANAYNEQFGIDRAKAVEAHYLKPFGEYIHHFSGILVPQIQRGEK